MTKYKVWTEADIAKGITMYDNGTSLRTVEEELGIPKSTLYNRLKKGSYILKFNSSLDRLKLISKSCNITITFIYLKYIYRNVIFSGF